MLERIQVNEKIYEVIKLLGRGKGGYSYLVRHNDRQYVVKQIHHEPCSYYTFGNKIEAETTAYETLAQVGIPIPKMLEVDKENERILKVYIDGPTIYECVLQDQMQENYVGQVKKMCDRLYPRNINIDYFPTNFIVCEGRIWYIDYECNTYMEEWNFENWGIQYWSKTQAFLDYTRNNEEKHKV